jgi:hypothetical protein
LPPQVPHAPFWQTPGGDRHSDPAGTQRLLTQQPPPVQVLPGQQASPARPHSAPSGSVRTSDDPASLFVPPMPVGESMPPSRLPPTPVVPPPLTPAVLVPPVPVPVPPVPVSPALPFVPPAALPALPGMPASTSPLLLPHPALAKAASIATVMATPALRIVPSRIGEPPPS